MKTQLQKLHVLHSYIFLAESAEKHTLTKLLNY